MKAKSESRIAMYPAKKEYPGYAWSKMVLIKNDIL